MFCLGFSTVFKVLKTCRQGIMLSLMLMKMNDSGNFHEIMMLLLT